MNEVAERLPIDSETYSCDLEVHRLYLNSLCVPIRREQASSVKYLEPFLSIVRSDKADANVTMTALRSLNKFLLYGFLNANSAYAFQAVNNVAHTVPRCRRFTESVLLLLLDVMNLAVQGSAGTLITDNNMYDLRCLLRGGAT